MNSHCWIATNQDEFLWQNNKQDWILHPPKLQTRIMAAYRQSGHCIENNIVFIPTKQVQVKISQKFVRDIKKIESNQSCEKVSETLKKLHQKQISSLKRRCFAFNGFNTMIHDMGGKIKSQYQNGPFDNLSALSLITNIFNKKKDGQDNEFCIFNKIE